MAQINPDLLLKDEVAFEMAARGLEHDKVDVATLRRGLRQAVIDNALVSAEFLAHLTPEAEISRCQKKFEEYAGVIEGIDVENSRSILLRYRARMEHLSRRLELVSKLLKEDKAESLGAYVNSMKASLPKLEKSLNAKLKEVESNVGASLLTPTVPPSTLPLTPSEPKVVEQQNVAPVVETVSVPDMDISAPIVRDYVPVMRDEASGGNLPVSSNLPISNNLPINADSFNASLYSKLPHPVERFLKGMQECDGLFVPKLLEFLRGVLKIREQLGGSNREILQLVFSVTKGPLAERTRLGIQQGWDFDRYHSDILNFFIPSRQLQTIRQDTYHRLQRVNEPLPCFIADVRAAAELLRLEVTEKEVVDTILDGINQIERSRFVFTTRPTNLNELDQLCIHSQNLSFSDRQRSLGQSSFPQRNFNFQKSSNVNVVQTPVVSSSRGGRGNFTHSQGRGVQPPQRRCFNCNEVGHLHYNCNKPRRNEKN